MSNLVNKSILALSGSGLLLALVYLFAGEALAIAMPIIFYSGSILAIITGLVSWLGFCYLRWKMIRARASELDRDVEIAKAEIIRAQAEAEKEQVMVITARRDDQIMVRDPHDRSSYRKLHLDPGRTNGHYENPTQLQIQLYSQFHGLPAGNHDEVIIDQPSDLDSLSQYDTDWLQTLVLPAPHVHLCGASGSGKTMLANHILVHIKETCPGAEFYLLNPKHTAARAPFIIEPTYDDVEQAEEGLRYFINLMEKRRHDPNFSQSSRKIIFVIDELDYIKDMRGKGVTRLVNPLVKMGRELNIKVIVIGQSPLSDDTGLSQSSFYNMCRVAIWREGERLLKDNPMEKKNKAPLVAQYETLKAMSPQYKLQTGGKLRYCLVTPLNGNPSVQVIPHLEDPVTGQKRLSNPPAPRPPSGSFDLKVCQAWYQVSSNKSPSGNKMHKIITGGDVNINSRQKKTYIQTLKKYGLEPGFLKI